MISPAWCRNTLLRPSVLPHLTHHLLSSAVTERAPRALCSPSELPAPPGVQRLGAGGKWHTAREECLTSSCWTHFVFRSKTDGNHLCHCHRAGLAHCTLFGCPSPGCGRNQGVDGTWIPSCSRAIGILARWETPQLLNSALADGTGA